MVSKVFMSKYVCLSVAAAACALLSARPARAQGADPNPGNLTMIGNVDVATTYMFRGIRQDDTRVMVQPSAELDIGLQSGDAGLKSTSLNLGTWNSLHTGDTGLRSATSGFGCACDKLWYESDFYTTLAFAFTGGTLGVTYTAYTSPNAGFNNVKEIMFKFGADDTAALGSAALHPWVIAAFEVDAANGHQADGGSKAGKYLELGITPGYSGSTASLAVPVKVGLSLGDYYELNEGTAFQPNFVDHKFGYLSLAGIVTIPIGGTTAYGGWNVHAGVEYERLGDTTKMFNVDENGSPQSNKVIASAGIGFTY
jgi:hypothetical protein